MEGGTAGNSVALLLMMGDGDGIHLGTIFMGGQEHSVRARLESHMEVYSAREAYLGAGSSPTAQARLLMRAAKVVGKPFA